MLVLREDHMVRDVLTHLSSTQLVAVANVHRWPCPKLKGLSLPSSATVENTLALDFIRSRYGSAGGHEMSVSEQGQTKRLERLGIFGRVGEESTWSVFLDKVASLTGTRLATRARQHLGVKPGDIWAFAYDFVPLETPPPGWSQVSRLDKVSYHTATHESRLNDPAPPVSVKFIKVVPADS
ncbi:hypothetical protein FRB94_002878 [Tulasnella sp. JGI-2019a]|nr:hypothetical protein FRB94_002878 [Tulasnella sp. JGI-2019a]KAG9004505.1 hypothetical protein FRB93_010282 [Tulasnella sp. JGI-2019a]